jgi:hypothetical protein
MKTAPRVRIGFKVSSRDSLKPPEEEGKKGLHLRLTVLWPGEDAVINAFLEGPVPLLAKKTGPGVPEEPPSLLAGQGIRVGEDEVFDAGLGKGLHLLVTAIHDHEIGATKDHLMEVAQKIFVSIPHAEATLPGAGNGCKS